MACLCGVFGFNGVQVYGVKEGGTASASGSFVADFKENFRMKVLKDEDDELVMDLIGIDAPIANALRRILLSEVPSVAVRLPVGCACGRVRVCAPTTHLWWPSQIEKVFILANTSVMQEEVFAHRLGLVPLAIDWRVLGEVLPDAGENALNVVKFRLDVTGRPREAGEEFTRVTSADLVWQPLPHQPAAFDIKPPACVRVPACPASSLSSSPSSLLGCVSRCVSSALVCRPVHDDILLCKLREGQRITAECWAIRGTGAEHAKWSPVATASYRLLPDIQLTEPVRGALAADLKAACPVNVFDIEDVAGGPQATVARPRDCTMCRNCIREAPLSQHVKLMRKRDHFICACLVLPRRVRPCVLCFPLFCVVCFVAHSFHRKHWCCTSTGPVPGGAPHPHHKSWRRLRQSSRSRGCRRRRRRWCRCWQCWSKCWCRGRCLCRRWRCRWHTLIHSHATGG